MQYFLPVSKEQRVDWAFSNPKSYSNADSDWVKYHAVPKEGDPPETNPSHKSTACYSSCRPRYSMFEITCMPNQKSGPVTLEDALEFFNIFTEHKIIPEGIVIREEKDGIHCIIPVEVGNPHNIYAALNCYRWLDSHYPLFLEFLQIMRRPEKRHPLQILPYLIDKNVTNTNHSFIATDSGTDLVNKPSNPLVGLAAKIYFDQDDERKRASWEDPTTYVNASISDLVTEITASISIENPSKRSWDPERTKVPEFVLEEAVDGLHPDLYELYTIPSITPKQVRKILSKYFTKERG